MSKFTLANLQTERDKILNRLKENYKLARDLGFTATEAQVLKAKSKEDIERLAAERKAENG